MSASQSQSLEPYEYVKVATGVELALHLLEFEPPTAEQSDSTKPPILFVHATGFGARTYKPFTNRLAEHFTVWAPDLRAHGWSATPADGEYLWTTLAEDLLAVVDHLGIAHGELDCVGHSIGAATLLLADAKRPGLIRRMYGYEPVIWRTSEVFAKDENPLIAGAEKRREVFGSRAEVMLRFGSRAPFSQVRADALYSYVEGGLEDLPDGTVRLRCRAADEADTYRGEYVATTDRVAGCLVPVIIGKGGDDTHGDVGVPAHEALANSRLIAYDDLGHFGPLQAPDRIADDAIAALLAGEAG